MFVRDIFLHHVVPFLFLSGIVSFASTCKEYMILEEDYLWKFLIGRDFPQADETGNCKEHFKYLKRITFFDEDPIQISITIDSIDDPVYQYLIDKKEIKFVGKRYDQNEYWTYQLADDRGCDLVRYQNQICKAILGRKECNIVQEHAEQVRNLKYYEELRGQILESAETIEIVKEFGHIYRYHSFEEVLNFGDLEIIDCWKIMNKNEKLIYAANLHKKSTCVLCRK